MKKGAFRALFYGQPSIAAAIVVGDLRLLGRHIC